MNIILKTRILAANEQIDTVGENADERVDPRTLALGEIAEHVMLDHFLGAGMTNADAPPPVIIADMRGDRAQTVVPGDAAADLDPHLARRQFDLVVEHGDVARRKL